MSNRTILIIAGLAVPVVALAILTQSAPPPKSGTTVAAKASIPVPGAKTKGKERIETLADAQSRVARRFEMLNKMRQQDWDNERKRVLDHNPNATPPLKIEEARARAKGNLDRLKGLTEEQWAEEAKQYRDKQNEAQADQKPDAKENLPN